eukprot:scaffold97157_cov29-Tisochrysis_lutea.AAC.1
MRRTAVRTRKDATTATSFPRMRRYTYLQLISAPLQRIGLGTDGGGRVTPSLREAPAAGGQFPMRSKPKRRVRRAGWSGEFYGRFRGCVRNVMWQ